MKIKEISYSKEELIPTGPYANKKFGATITYTLEDGEEPNHQRARTDLQTAIEYQKKGIEMDIEFPDKDPNGPMPFGDEPPTPARLVQKVQHVAQVAAEARGEKMCPKCGAPLKEAKKKDGTPYWKCSTNKWDRVTGTATGCDYVDWGTGTRPAQVGPRPATPAQKRIIQEKWPAEWVDGMTIKEAYDVIASHPK